MGAVMLVFNSFIGLDFLQAGDRGEFVLELELPAGTTLAQTNEATLQAEEIILNIPVVKSVFTTVGITSSARLTLNVSHTAELSIKLVDKAERDISASLLSRQLKYQLEREIPGIVISPVEINLLGIRDDGPVEVILSGTEQEFLQNIALDVVNWLDSIPGSVEVKSVASAQRPELLINPRYEIMRENGINLIQLGLVTRTAFNGNTDAQFNTPDEKLDINVHLRPENRSQLADIRKLTLLTKEGAQIQIGQLADITSAQSPATLERTNRQRSVTIKSQAFGRPAGSIANDLQDVLEKQNLPDDLSFQFTGNIQRQRDSFFTLGLAFGVSVFFVYLVMVALYDSYRYPFVVLFSIPLAVIGALVLLGLTKNALTIFSIMGMIMLVGLVGKNAILVVDFTNKLKKEGMELKNALLEATRLRFRPVLMTNISMIIGLLPIALASGAGAEWKNGLAWALIGGLSSSMLLSLVIVPLVYYLFDHYFGQRSLKPADNPVN
jgi:multidrug efflux pump subunit AcrB